MEYISNKVSLEKMYQLIKSGVDKKVLQTYTMLIPSPKTLIDVQERVSVICLKNGKAYHTDLCHIDYLKENFPLMLNQ